jgi:hypothetical protein
MVLSAVLAERRRREEARLARTDPARVVEPAHVQPDPATQQKGRGAGQRARFCAACCPAPTIAVVRRLRAAG